MPEIKEVWFGKRNSCDIIVKLVRRNNDSNIKTIGSHCKKPICTRGRSKKHGLELDGGQNVAVLAIFHLHSDTLQSSRSKYFEACLSNRWTLTHLQKQSTELVLEAQSDVGHYVNCFSTMYEWTSTEFGSIVHCIGMLKVAVQLLYERVVADGICYLSTMQWSESESKLVHGVVVGSESFPLDSAKDVLARLGMTHRMLADDDNANTGIHDIKLQDVAKITLKRVFVDALHDNQDPMLIEMKKLMFTKTFKQLILKPSPNVLTEFALDLVNGESKSMIESLIQRMQDIIQNLRSPMTSENTLKKIDWLLGILLNNNVAKYAIESILDYDENLVTVVHYIFNFHIMLNPHVDVTRSSLLQHFAETLCSIFVKVAQGRVLLTTHMRYKLIYRWCWLMLRRLDKDNAHWALARTSITKLVGSLPLLSQTLIFKNLHDDCDSQIILGEAYVIWFHRVMCKYDPEMLDSSEVDL